MASRVSRGIVISSFRDKPSIRSFNLPKLQQDQVLIKVKFSPINPSDLNFITGRYGTEQQRRDQVFPVLCGNEGSGVVVDVNGVDCQQLIGRRVGFLKSLGDVGSWGDYTIVDKTMLQLIPDHISDEVGSCLYVNPLSVALMTLSAKQLGTKAIVQDLGASQVGKMVQRACERIGIKTINIVRRQNQIDSIISPPPGHFWLNSQDKNFGDDLEKLCKELDPKLAFDAVGSQVLNTIVDKMPDDSQIWLYGFMSMRPPRNIYASSLIFDNKAIKGFWLNTFIRLEKHRKLIEESRQFVVDNIDDLFTTDIQGIFRSEDYDQAVATYTRNMSHGKVLLKF